MKEAERISREASQDDTEGTEGGVEKSGDENLRAGGSDMTTIMEGTWKALYRDAQAKEGLPILTNAEAKAKSDGGEGGNALARPKWETLLNTMRSKVRLLVYSYECMVISV